MGHNAPCFLIHPMKKTFQGVVRHEHMAVFPKNLEEFKYLISLFEDEVEVTVTVETLVRKVSRSQMGLYFLYIDLFCNETGNDTVEADKIMKSRFGARNESGNLKSKSDYSTSEMNRLIDGTYNFLVTELNMNIPTPEEYKEKNLK